MEAEYKLLYIIVNYFSEEEVSKFISLQLSRQTFKNIWIIIVNNGCRDPNVLEKIIEENKTVELLNSQNNLGYFGAAKFALEHYLETYSIPDYTILSNVDLIFENERDIEKLCYESPVYADIIGPNLLSSNHRTSLNPFYEKRISKRKLKFLAAIFSIYPLYILYQTISIISKHFKRFRTTINSKSRFVYAVHGAMIVFRKNYFEKGGNLNYGSFLFGEELFVAEVARKYSLKIFFNANVKVIHHEHTTTGTYKRPKYVLWMKDSLSYILANHFQG
jgi:GT2 family glycosyltransferase